LDVEIFRFSKCALIENMKQSNLDVFRSPFLDSTIQIYKIFEFDFSLQRMSALFSYKDKYYLSIKGSPEALKPLINARKLPDNYDYIFKKYSFAGYRLLAFGIKEVSLSNIENMKREEIEREVDFSGSLFG
jgi:magnesium-transporting ATPase (P-type)